MKKKIRKTGEVVDIVSFSCFSERSMPNNIVAAAVCFADTLIEKLKKGGNNA
jgi:hypothetical protein